MADYTTINDAGSFFNPVTYTGTGSSNTVTGVGFQPDFTWIKNRGTTDGQDWYDSVRGAGQRIRSNTTAIESDQISDSLSAWVSDGFTVLTNNAVNASANTYASWNLKAGTTTGIAGSPSITPSSYSFNATSGYSIIAYTGNGSSGATLPHGLGVAPDMIIVKKLNGATDWMVYTSALGATKYLVLNTQAVAGTDTAAWNDTAPTSTLFYLGDWGNVNASSDTYIAYCFTSIQGYSKFSSYTGNGSTNGALVYTGFRPAFVMLKCATRAGTDSWRVFDDKRLGYNVDNNALAASDTDAERTQDDIDIISNGWKCRNSVTDINANADTMVYMAFAQSPVVNSNGIPTNAR